MLYLFQVRRNQRFLAPVRELTRIFDFTWEKPVCCVSKISSDCGCQSKEIGVGMEVRLLSVGTRGFFLAASRLAFAAPPLNPVAPNEKKTSGTQGKRISVLPPQKGIRISWGMGGGSVRPKNLKKCMKLNWNF